MVLHQLPGVEVAFVSDQIVADVGKGDDINPGRLVASLLEGDRDERGRDVRLEGVKGRVVTAGRGHGADGRVGGYGVEGMHIKYEGAKYVILDEMKEVV
jgi:hypothetical protein